MAMAGTTDERHVWQATGRVGCAVLIVMFLSSGPASALSRWVARIPVAPDTWPYVYTFWIAALLGFVLFVVDVISPWLSRARSHSDMAFLNLAVASAFALWTLASVVWTDSPGRTPKQALLMVLVLATAIWFGSGLTFSQQVVALFVGLHILTVTSVVAALTLHSARFRNGAWMGVFNNPNSLSPVAGLGVVTAIGLVRVAGSARIRNVAGLCALVDIAAMWKASSGTGWLAFCAAGAATAIILIGYGLVAKGVPMTGIRWFGTAAAAVVVLSIPWSFRRIAGRFGRDGTMTGRTVIWDYIGEVLDDRWLTGFGYQSFWDVESNRLELASRRSFVTLPDAAHSSFMEILLFLGVIGLGLLLVVVALSTAIVWWSALGGQSWATGWWTVVATFALSENLTESMIAYHSIFWVLLVAPGFAAVRTRGRQTPDHSSRARRAVVSWDVATGSSDPGRIRRQ